MRWSLLKKSISAPLIPSSRCASDRTAHNPVASVITRIKLRGSVLHWYLSHAAGIMAFSLARRCKIRPEFAGHQGDANGVTHHPVCGTLVIREYSSGILRISRCHVGADQQIILA